MLAFTRAQKHLSIASSSTSVINPTGLFPNKPFSTTGAKYGLNIFSNIYSSAFDPQNTVCNDPQTEEENTIILESIRCCESNIDRYATISFFPRLTTSVSRSVFYIEQLRRIVIACSWNRLDTPVPAC